MLAPNVDGVHMSTAACHGSAVRLLEAADIAGDGGMGHLPSTWAAHQLLAASQQQNAVEYMLGFRMWA